MRLIEDHAEQITNDLICDLKVNPRTASYHGLADSEIHRRVFNVYRNLGEWLSGEAETTVEAHYFALGKNRALEGVPLSQVLYALVLTKSQLFNYIRRTVLLESAIDLYQLHELRDLTDDFFDYAVYQVARGYEHAQALNYAQSATAS